METSSEVQRPSHAPTPLPRPHSPRGTVRSTNAASQTRPDGPSLAVDAEARVSPDPLRATDRYRLARPCDLLQ
jgi:hypothetical protein